MKGTKTESWMAREVVDIFNDALELYGDPRDNFDAFTAMRRKRLDRRDGRLRG